MVIEWDKQIYSIEAMTKMVGITQNKASNDLVHFYYNVKIGFCSTNVACT
jgi:hypothetical protein